MSALARELGLYEWWTTKVEAPYSIVMLCLVFTEWDEAKLEVEEAVARISLNDVAPVDWYADEKIRKIASKALPDSKHYDELIEDATDRGFPIPKTFEAIETLVGSLFQAYKEGKRPKLDELRWKLGIGPEPLVRRA